MMLEAIFEHEADFLANTGTGSKPETRNPKPKASDMGSGETRHPTSERRRRNLKGFEDFDWKAEARIRP